MAGPNPETAIGLLGDVMLGRGVAAELAAGRSGDDVWDPELRALGATLDLVVCNLECCLSDRGDPTTLIQGKPFFFRGPPAGVGALQAIGVRGVGLANNHALDFGPEALSDTLAALREAGIAAAGAGRGRAAARTGAVVSAGETRVGLVAATDHPVEFAAGSGEWGVAYADLRAGPPEWLLREITAVRERCDLVVASLHWGPNMATRPAGWQQELAAALQSAGADLVAGHSAHLFQGVAWASGGPVLYDLGDALDDYAVDRVRRNDLGLLAVWRPWNLEDELQLVGLRLEYARTGLAAGADADWIAARLTRACREQGSRVERVAEDVFRVRRM
jgi:poly-gamma-glutamate capsule biosynthesis protein CapA/YwtB (metallophosphatase superfamily)